MNLTEYTHHDALGLAQLVARGEVTPTELARLAAQAIAAANPLVNAVVETYPDRIESLDERSLGSGPFRGVPFLMKDVFGHEAGRKVEFGSRLCRGMVAEQDTAYCQLVKAAGVNVIGRSAAPEYSMAGTTEGALYGNTSTPWRHGYCAGGSTGGGMAAAVAGMVPIAHGSDIAGSIRMPATFCGGVGLKPSRGRVSFAPMLDENGFGLAQNFVQTRTVRDTATMLDCLAIPQPGDPFLIPRQAQPYSEMMRTPARPLRIGFTTHPLMGFAVDPQVADAVRNAAQFMGSVAGLNTARRQLGAFFTRHDIWLSPTAANVAEPWGRYHLGRDDVGVEEMAQQILAPVCQFTLPHNLMGTPAISLSLAMHASGLPIGVQWAAGPANEHLLLQLAAALEVALPWADRVPPLRVTNAA